MAKKTSKPGVRRKGRTLAFQVLYGLGFAESSATLDANELHRLFGENPAVKEEADPDVLAFAENLVRGVHGNSDGLGEVVQRFSQHWKLNRIARIELAILRLSLFEMLHSPDIPLKVAINEGVELAKKFGDENSRNFINGILDAAAKAVAAGEYSVKKDMQTTFNRTAPWASENTNRKRSN